MNSITDMEAQAIKDARQPLYEALVRIDVADAFNGCSSTQIDFIIETIWDAVRASMQTQSALGAIPVPLGPEALKARALP